MAVRRCGIVTHFLVIFGFSLLCFQFVNGGKWLVLFVKELFLDIVTESKIKDKRGAKESIFLSRTLIHF